MDQKSKGEVGPQPADTSLGGFSVALKVIWAALFAAIGILTLLRVLDTSTTVEIPALGARNPDGTWSVVAVERICREALVAHGEDPAGAVAVDHVQGSRYGESVTAPARLLTAWTVGAEGRRVEVYIDIEGDTARCVVSESD